MTRTFYAALVAACLLAPGARAQLITYTVDHSVAVGTTVTQVFPAMTLPTVRTILRFQVTTAGATLWCRFDGSNPGVGALGSFPYTGIGAGEDFETTGWVPQGAVLCIASTGTINVTAVSAPQ